MCPAEMYAFSVMWAVALYGFKAGRVSNHGTDTDEPRWPLQREAIRHTRISLLLPSLKEGGFLGHGLGLNEGSTMTA